MAEGFGAVLRRLRESTLMAPHPRGGGWPGAVAETSLPQSTLSRMAGLDPANVHLLEHGRRHPSRGVVEKLCRALGCSEGERALLLVSAGYWPWPDTDDARTELLIGLCLAVLDGDYRPLHAAESGPIASVLR